MYLRSVTTVWYIEQSQRGAAAVNNRTLVNRNVLTENPIAEIQRETICSVSFYSSYWFSSFLYPFILNPNFSI
jgi:hypothetical protein